MTAPKKPPVPTSKPAREKGMPKARAKRTRKPEAKRVPKRERVGNVPPSPVVMDRYRRFAQEYVVDRNGTQAAIRAGYAERGAHVTASRLLTDPNVQRLVYEAQAVLEEKTAITAAKVLRYWWDIATADARELMQYRRCNCRYCYGVDHQYQFIDMADFNDATEAWLKRKDESAKLAKALKVADPFNIEPPSLDGGLGFNPTLSPHAKCPKCFGEGHGEVFIHDTRQLSEIAAKLYRGVAIGAGGGMKVLTADQDAAMKNVAIHLGMLDPKLTLKGDADNPLTLLLSQIGRGSNMPVVSNPPDED